MSIGIIQTLFRTVSFLGCLHLEAFIRLLETIKQINALLPSAAFHGGWNRPRYNNVIDGMPSVEHFRFLNNFNCFHSSVPKVSELIAFWWLVKRQRNCSCAFFKYQAIIYKPRINMGIYLIWWRRSLIPGLFVCGGFY